MTNLEGRVLLRRQAKPPPPGVWTDLQVIAGHCSARLGAGAALLSGDAAATGVEFRRCDVGRRQADYAGADLGRGVQAAAGLFWPCPDAGPPRHAAAVHWSVSPMPDGLARFPSQSSTADPPEPPCDEFPLILTTGRVMGQYQSGTQTRRIPELAAAEPGSVSPRCTPTPRASTACRPATACQLDDPPRHAPGWRCA